MRDIYLYGHLAECFGPHHRYNVKSVQEAMWALDVNHDGKFFSEIRKDGLYQVVRGETLEDDQLSEEQLVMKFGKGSFHICPLVEGSGGGVGKGIGVAIVGVALAATGIGLAMEGMAAGFSFGAAMGFAAPSVLGTTLGMTLGTMTLLGATLAFAGISQLMTSPVKEDDYEARDAAEDQKSSLFNGPVNTMEQGTAIPVVFGRHWIGSTVISAGLTVEEDPV